MISSVSGFIVKSQIIQNNAYQVVGGPVNTMSQMSDPGLAKAVHDASSLPIGDPMPSNDGNHNVG